VIYCSDKQIRKNTNELKIKMHYKAARYLTKMIKSHLNVSHTVDVIKTTEWKFNKIKNCRCLT